MKRLVLIDAHAVIHRAYHALPPLTTPGGEPSHAVYGFTTILLRMLKELKPDYVAAAFDLPGPTFRHIAYERYKAQRPETPSDLSSQFAKVRDVLAAFGVPVFERAGFEADDVIGTLAKKLEKNKNLEVIVVTGDLDTLQLVRPRLRVYSMKKGISETVLYDEKAVKERYGLKPSQLTDFKGLKGDPSDNIPGVKGVGEKTAAELVGRFGSIEKIYAALERGTKPRTFSGERKMGGAKRTPEKVRGKKIPAGVAEKLRVGRDDAFFSRELATINSKVPLEFKLDELSWGGQFDSPGTRKIFQKLGFFSLLKRMGENGSVARSKTDKKTSTQATLPEVGTGDPAVKFGPEEPRRLLAQKAEGVGAAILGGKLFLVTPKAKVLELDDGWLKRPEIKKIFEEKNFYVYDFKSLIRFLKKHGIRPPVVKFDLMLAAYVAGSFIRDFSYEAVAARELGGSPGRPEEELAHFFELARLLETKFEVGRLRSVFEDIEMPLPPILAAMEERGILLDKDFLAGLSTKADKKIRALTEEIHKLAGEHFNINSSQQLSRILFEKLAIRTAGLRKTAKSGVVSTRESELVKLRGVHSIVDKILEYREFTKLKTTYIDALPELVNSETGRIHTTFNQTGTATGRLSSSSPNLQNIPIMSEFGREIRKAFVAERGYELVSFDYSQIELRVAAHIANDQKMIAAFKRGVDIHSLTASEVNNIPLEKVTPDLRRAAKTLNFGILYGMGPQALAESTGMSREEARKFIDEYFRDFQGIKKYVEETKRFAEENGYVETIFGRRRYIPEVRSPNWQIKREAERMAVNMPIQGSATGDIVKLAMIKIDDWVRKRKLAGDVRLLLQVHDELLFEIKKELVGKATPRIKKIMENAAELKVPLVVDVKAGLNWGGQRNI